MTVIFTSDPNGIYATGGDNQTIVVAPNINIGMLAVFDNDLGGRLVNYGTISDGSGFPPVWFGTGSSGVFINEAGGVVTNTRTDGGIPAVKLYSTASVINEGNILSNSHGISISGAANNDSIANSGD